MTDLAELLEQEKMKEQAAVEEKLKAKMRRQIRIFNKEKSAYTRRTRYEASKQRRALNVLEIERDIELDNYLATQSEAIEKLYKKEEARVIDLVNTTDHVRALLANETENTKSLEAKVEALNAHRWEQKKAVTQVDIANSTFRIPDKAKMERRIECVCGKYHSQLYKNKGLQEKIDSCIYLRDKFMKEEGRMKKQLETLNKAVTSIMNETAEIYEQRDRAEGTKLKVREHLAKVKEQYERELLNITLAINDSKKMENFMRTKHKDNTHYLQQKREKELADVIEMVNRKDEFSLAFDTIKEATGKDDLNQIVQDFIEKEEDNFSTFLSIGELLDENERIRARIRELRQANVSMEEKDIQVLQDTGETIVNVQGRIDSYRLKSEACQRRLVEHSNTLDAFTEDIHRIIGLLKLDKAALGDFVCKDGQIKDTNLPGVMTAIEKELANLMKDYYMVELSTRAVVRSKSELTPDERMVTRIPSFRIGPHTAPRVTPSHVMKEKDEVEEMRNSGLLKHEEVRDVVVKSMLEKKTQGQLTDKLSKRSNTG